MLGLGRGHRLPGDRWLLASAVKLIPGLFVGSLITAVCALVVLLSAAAIVFLAPSGQRVRPG